MKQIFTLVTAFTFSYLSGFSQINQTFETVSDLQMLTNNCWQFSGVVFYDTSNYVYQIYGSNSLAMLATTSSTGYGTIVTPYVNLTTGSSIAFTYKLGNKLAGNAARTITVRLQDLDGSFTTLGSVTLDRFTPVSVLSFSTSSPVTGIKKIVIEINGNADGNSHLFLDNFIVDGTFNYNSPYGCNTAGNIPLPVKLTGFDGLLVSGKTQLQWAVAENEGGDYFEIEKSEDGTRYKSVGVIFSTDRKGSENYLYKDPQTVTTTTQYRLKTASKTGGVAYSKVLVLKPGQTLETKALTLLQNPVINQVAFTVTTDQSGVSNLSIYNTSGIKVYSGTLSLQKGSNVFNLSLDGKLSTGSYILETTNSGGRNTAKFLKM